MTPASRRRLAAIVGAAALVSGIVGCSSDGDGALRSVEPSRADVASLEGARARLVEVAVVDGTPTGLAERAGDPGRYILTRGGTLVRSVRGRVVDTVLDVSDRVTSDGEGGAFDVAFTTDGRQVLVSYADRSSHELRIARRTVSDGGEGTGPLVTVAVVGDGGEIHNGGKLVVTEEGDVLLGVGDGGELLDVAGRARRAGSERGRILRFRHLGTSGAEQAKPTTVASGLRNPWRFFVDPVTGTTWIGDVGQDRWEEIDRIDPSKVRAGAALDFGWDLTEGFQRARGLPPDDMTFPVAVAPHASDRCAIVGGPIVRDPSVPSLVGTLLVGDFCSSSILVVRFDAAGDPVEQRTLTLPGGATVASFAVGLDHEVYVLRTDGEVSVLTAGGDELADAESPFGVRARPSLAGNEAICGLPAALAGYPAMQGKPPDEVRQLATDLRDALDAYRTAELPDAAVEPFQEVDSALSDYLEQLEESGWDPASPGLAFAGQALETGRAQFEVLSTIESDRCR